MAVVLPARVPSPLHHATSVAAIARADALFGRLIGHLDLRRTRTVLLTPAPPADDDGQIRRLAPIAAAGDGPGLLSSATTRGDGLIANIDLAPTLGDVFGSRGDGPAMTGAPFSVTRRDDAPAWRGGGIGGIGSVPREAGDAHSPPWESCAATGVVGAPHPEEVGPRGTPPRRSVAARA